MKICLPIVFAVRSIKGGCLEPLGGNGLIIGTAFIIGTHGLGKKNVFYEGLNQKSFLLKISLLKFFEERNLKGCLESQGGIGFLIGTLL